MATNPARLRFSAKFSVSLTQLEYYFFRKRKENTLLALSGTPLP